MWTDGLIVRCQNANEDGLIRGLWTLKANIVGQRLASDGWQRQGVLVQCLGAFDRDGAIAPVNISQLKFGYFASAQSQI